MLHQKSLDDIEMDVLIPHRTSLLNDEVSTKRGFKGWRFSLLCGAVLATLVFIINISLLIWASINHTVDDHIVTLYSGSCSTMKDISRWTHLGINVLSTLLLSASNVCMQCLSAPTRVELNKQHAMGRWLTIGVMSLRNLRAIATWRLCLWSAVGLSSIPLHLLYNSVLFSTTSTNEYMVVLGASNFIDGPLVSTSSFLPNNEISTSGSLITDIQTNASSWENLTNVDCIKAYNQMYVSDYRNLVLVTGTPNDTNPVLNWDYATSNNWVCSSDHSYCPVVLSNGHSWNGSLSTCDDLSMWCYQPTIDIPIDYCMAQPVNPTCKVQLGQIMLIVVIICNAVKVGCMVITIIKSDFRPLITTGDAVSSFLSDPDETTRDFGPFSAIDVRKRVHSSLKDSSRDVERPEAFQYTKRERWFRAASLTRWGVAIVLFLAAWLTGLGLLLEATSDSSTSEVWSTGLGDAETTNTVNVKGSSLGAVVLLSNVPQLIISLLYVMYNNLFTCMLSAAELCDFAKQQKALRVSEPNGQQRSTYWLSLPYRYAIPLMASMGMLHWFISQSIFLINVQAFDYYGKPNVADNVTVCGWSAKGIVASVALGGVMIIVVIAFGFKKFESGIPLLSNCSIAISAACHPLPTDVGISELPVKYGVLQDSKETGGQERVGFGTNILRPLVDRHYIIG